MIEPVNNELTRLEGRKREKQGQKFSGENLRRFTRIRALNADRVASFLFFKKQGI